MRPLRCASVALASVLLVGCSTAVDSSTDEAASSPATTQVETEAPASAPTGGAAPSTAPEEQETTALPPLSIEIDGCASATGDLVAQVEQGLTGDATALRLAYTTTDDEGRQVFGASIYDDTGFRVSSSDTWLVADGEVYALSGSANEYTEFPDGRDLEGNPSAGIGAPRALQDECLIPAIRS